MTETDLEPMIEVSLELGEKLPSLFHGCCLGLGHRLCGAFREAGGIHSKGRAGHDELGVRLTER